MCNKINIGRGLRAILGLLFVFSLMLFSKSSRAYDTTIEWELRGNDLYYIITSTNEKMYPGTFNCGWRGTCYVMLTLDGTGNPAKAKWKDYIRSLTGNQSSSAIIREWSSYSLPRSGVIVNWFDQVANGNDCILLYVSSDAGRLSMFGDSCQGTITPPPIQPPLPPVSCSIRGDITLAHGMLNKDNLNGNTKSVNTQVSCNRDANVKITALANNGGDVVTLRSDGSLK